MRANHSSRHAACPCRVPSHSHLCAPSGSGAAWLGGSQRPARHAQGPWHRKLAPSQQQPTQPRRVPHAVPTEDLDLIDQLLADIEPPPAATPPEGQLVDTPAAEATSTPAGASWRAPSRLLQKLRGKRSSTTSESSSSSSSVAASSQTPQPDIPPSTPARKQRARSGAAAAAAAPRRPSSVIQMTDWDSTSSEPAGGFPRTRGGRTAAGAGAAAAAGPGLPLTSPWQALRQELAAAQQEERQQAAAAAAAAAAEAAAAAAKERRERLAAQAQQLQLPSVRRALGPAATATGGQDRDGGSSALPLVRSTRGRSSRGSRGPAPPAAAAAASAAAAAPPAAATTDQPGQAAPSLVQSRSPVEDAEGATGAPAAPAAVTPVELQPHDVGLAEQQQQQQQGRPSAPHPTSSSSSSSSSRQRPAARRGSRAAAATAAVAAARASAAAAGLLEGSTPTTPPPSAPAGGRPQSGRRGRRAVPVHSLGPITQTTWQEAGQAAFPGLFDSSWHTSLYALLVDLCVQLMDWQQQQLEQEEQQQQQQQQQQAAAGQSGKDQSSTEQQASAGVSSEDKQAPSVPAGSARSPTAISSSSSGQPPVDVEQIGGFLAACLSSQSMYAQLSAGMALASRAACRPLVLQPLGSHLPPPLLQQTLLPCLSLLAPDAVVEVLRVLRRLHPAAPLGPSPSRELLAALGQLEGLLGVYPGADLGLLVHVAPAHGLLQD